MSADVRRRMLDLAKRIYEGKKITTRDIREGYGVSTATAKRDMIVLEATLPVRVTHIVDDRRPKHKLLAFALMGTSD